MRPEVLLEHADFVRGLARSLVIDEHTADDIAQQTWLAAVEHEPDSSKPLYSWLSRTLRNFARLSHRSDRRRLRRERIATSPEPVPSPDLIAEREEIRRKMIDSVLELDETYRSVVLLRYYEDLPPRAIARRLEIPVETARTRLKRALVHLRKKLDAEHGGDREKWCLALAPIAGIHLTSTTAGASTGISAVISGVMTMCTNVNFVFIALGVVAASFALYSLWPDESMDSVESLLIAGDEVVGAEEPIDQVAVAEPERVPVEPTGPQEGEDDQDDEALFAGRIMDQSGKPIAGVNLYVEERPLLLSQDGNFLYDESQFPSLIGATGSDGRFKVTFGLKSSAKHQQLSLMARKEWHATKRWKAVAKAGETVFLGDIVMDPGGAVSGRIVDTSGNALAGAEIRCTGTADDSRYSFDFFLDLLDPQIRSGRYIKMPMGLPRSDIIGDKAVSDGDGRFRVNGLPVGKVRVWAGSADAFVKWSDPVDVRRGEVTSNGDLALELIGDDDRVKGTVLDPEGNPCGDVNLSVVFESLSDRNLKGRNFDISIDDKGRFSFVTNCKEPMSLTATAKGGNSRARMESVTPGSSELVLQLQVVSRDSLFLDVRSDAGKRMGSFLVFVITGVEGIPIEDMTTGDMIAFADTPTAFNNNDLAEDGLAEVVVPDGAFLVMVRAEGYMDVTMGPYPPGSNPEKLEVTLQTVPGFEGRVMSADGPIAGAKVSLHRAVSPDQECSVFDFACRSVPFEAAESTTDKDGKFRLTFWVNSEVGEVDPDSILSGLSSKEAKDKFEFLKMGNLFSDLGVSDRAEYYIRADADGYAPGELGPIEVDPESGQSGLELMLNHGGSIEGRVRVKLGQSVEGIIVAVSRGDGFPRTQRTGPNGTYRFERLTPGNWQVEQREVEIDPNPLMGQTISTGDPFYGETAASIEWTCTVKEGETTKYDLDLYRGTKGTLAGTITLGSMSLEGYVVDILRADDYAPPIPAVKVSGDGSFNIRNLDPGRYIINIGPPSGTDLKIEVVAQIRIERGENPWVFEPDFGRLELKGVPPVDGDVTRLYYQWRRPDYHGIELEFKADADGVAVLPEVPAGKGKIILSKKKGEDEGTSRKTLTEVDVPAGGTVVVDLEQK